MQFLGTAFVFGSPQHFLTAAHCVGDVAPNRMAVLLPAGWSTVSSIEKHPSADLAVLTGSGNLAGLEPFKVYADRFAAEHYCALGYPEDSLTTGSTMPTFREFLCHVQRDLPYKSFAGYEYKAYVPPKPVAPVKPRIPSLQITASVARRQDLRLHHGRIYLLVGCNLACSIYAHGHLNLTRHHRHLGLRSKRATLAANETVRIALSLSRSNLAAVRRALRRHRSVRASIAVDATGPSGQRQTYHVSVVLSWRCHTSSIAPHASRTSTSHGPVVAAAMPPASA